MELRPSKPQPSVDTGSSRDAAFVLAMVMAGIFVGAIVTLILIEFLDKLPGPFGTVIIISLVAFAAVLVKAVVTRLLTTPNMARTRPPVLRSRGRRAA